MVRVFVAACALSCLAASAWAQGQPAPSAAATPSATAVKPVVKKPAPKAKTSAKPPAPVASGPCQIGVISAVGDEFVVQKVGLTLFNNDYAEVPIEAWGLDDLVVARVRAAIAPGTVVQRISYPKGSFAPYDHPASGLFRNPRGDLTTIVQQIAGNSGCGRYVVVTKIDTQVDGTNQSHRGIGVLNRGIGSGVLSNTSLFASINVWVMDGQTFAIRKRPIDFGAILAGSLRMTQDPLTKLENDAFPEPAAAAAASATLRDHTRALLTAVLDKNLAASLKEE
jgi:hypothetical protein